MSSGETWFRRAGWALAGVASVVAVLFVISFCGLRGGGRHALGPTSSLPFLLNTSVWLTALGVLMIAVGYVGRIAVTAWVWLALLALVPLTLVFAVHLRLLPGCG